MILLKGEKFKELFKKILKCGEKFDSDTPSAYKYLYYY